MPKKDAVVPVDAQDLVYRLAEFRKELGCEARVIIKLEPGGTSDLHIVLEAYTDHGAPIGVARQIGLHRPRPTKGLLADLMGMLHRLYWEAEQKAHVAYHHTADDGGS